MRNVLLYFYYLALLVLLLSNIKFWGQKKALLNGIWSDISVFVVVLAVVLLLIQRVIKSKTSKKI